MRLLPDRIPHFENASPSVGEHDSGILRNLVGQLSDLAFAKNDFDRIVKLKVVHGFVIRLGGRISKCQIIKHG